jgi:FokI, cleavage domain
MNKKQIKQIQTIWDNYIKSNKTVLDNKGNELTDIDKKRNEAIVQLKEIIEQFNNDESNIYEFKTNIDSFNKRNNLWGFTATKGQMFFNQLVKYSESKIEDLSLLLKQVIFEPKDLADALSKIEKLEKYCLVIFNKAKDKRKVPNPGSVGYYLSYFWQIHDNTKWPVLFTSQINSYKELSIWEDKSSQKETYGFFYSLNEEIKQVLKFYSQKNISNWDAEHAFWNFKGNPNKEKEKKKKEKTDSVDIETSIVINSSFELSDYLIPKVSKLIELGHDSEKSSATKGSDYEKLVAEIFKQLDFEVEILGQGTGRNPDAIIRLREENTAFIVDAKAYSNGYSLGVDDRAIKEYINHSCPKLQKEGYKKIGFIIVSNSFKSNFDSFINEITWNTDIKRFILLSSEALLYLLAYKTKDRLSLSTIIESIIGFGNPVTANEIIEKFDDV